MDHPNMTSNGAPNAGAEAMDARRYGQQPSSRQTNSTQEPHQFAKPYASSGSRSLRSSGAAGVVGSYSSPAKKDKKHVVFQLIDPADPRIQARLPMRVMISPHDTAQSIITGIKNFYGLYDFGVSFENKDGNMMFAAYENFEHDMTVYVRTVPLPADYARDSASPKKPSLGAPIDLRHSALVNSPARSAARSAGVRSLSPQSDTGRRSMSATVGGKPRPQRTKSKDNSVYGDADGYSSGDNGEGSVASSRRSKAEVVNAEISVDNIVEGGRRKRAFESSELPLFVPPQVPMTASISSVSPQRRNGPPNLASPYAQPNQQTFSYQQALPSPQSYGSAAHQHPSSATSNGYGGNYAPPTRQTRGRSSQIFYPPRHSSGGILPTPDPTVGSAISDEDVALQLMRLGDPTAFSHGRTSNSTLDDALSGKAEAASSDEEDEDDDEEEADTSMLSTNARVSMGSNPGPIRKKQRLMNDLPSDGTSGEEYEDHRDGTFHAQDELRRKSSSSANKTSKPRLHPSSSSNGGAGKPRTSSSLSKSHKSSHGSGKAQHQHHAHLHNNHPHHKAYPSASSSTSMPAPAPRKSSLSTFQHPITPSASSAGAVPTYAASTASAASSTAHIHHSNSNGSAAGDDGEDLSTKPRCQRCRKSKKGCDRQRPCGRCRDAGIGIEGCISEDEENGRKGRYGRHMGVSVKKAEEEGVTGLSTGHGHGSGPGSGSNSGSGFDGAGYGVGNSTTTTNVPLLAAEGDGLAKMGYAGYNGAAATMPPGFVANGASTSPALNGGFLAPALPDKNKKRKR